MDLSIIIVNWNSEDYLEACLKTVYQQVRDCSYEVIVVDNASEDDCGAMLGKKFPEVKFFQSGENLGFARANNLGFQESSGDCLLFLNPDTEVLGDAVVRMLSRLRSNRSVGAGGARLLNTDRSLQTSCIQAFPTISNQVLDSDFLRRLFPQWSGWGMQALFTKTGSRAEVEAISGACFMVKRSVFQEVGLFSTQYFMYSDDLDLSYKIHQAGYSIHCFGDCEIVHHGGKSSSRQEVDFTSLWQKESMLYFFRATRGSWYCALYRVSIAIAAVLRMAAIVFMSLFRRRIDRKPLKSVLRKWSTIFCWSAGLNSNYRSIGKTPPVSPMIRSTVSHDKVVAASTAGATRQREGRYAMVTPVYNEVRYIGAMIESVLSQTIQPARWIIVDDGSTDGTADLVASYAERYEFLQLIRRPIRSERLPGGEGAIETGLQQLDLSQYEFFARFDADLKFDANYMECILDEFFNNPRLGIAGGGLYVERNDRMELEVVPIYHVRGAVKMYRRRCFEQIGGLRKEIGWDTIDEVQAWVHGWETKSFFRYRVIHCRPTGRGIKASRIYWQRGMAEYNSWSSPFFVFTKTARIAIRELAPIKAICFLAGFISAYMWRAPRIQDPSFVKMRRMQQINRMLTTVRLRKEPRFQTSTREQSASQI